MAKKQVQFPFRVIAYVTEKARLETIRYARLTHINYAFLIPHRDGTFRKLKHPEKLAAIVQEAHQHGVKVLISVGGWGWDSQFEYMASSPERRARHVAGLLRIVKEYGLDGVDMDWEYPDPGDSAQNFLALMRELRQALPKSLLLTAAVVALGDHYGLGIPVEAFALMDFVNLMAYDGGGAHHSSRQYAQDSLDYWLRRGVPKDKAVLGMPFYSRPKGVPYAHLVKTDARAAGQDTFICNDAEVNYNGIPTIQYKTRMAMERGAGIMFWTLEHDLPGEYSLLEAIHRELWGK
jgi:chitinase